MNTIFTSFLSLTPHLALSVFLQIPSQIHNLFKNIYSDIFVYICTIYIYPFVYICTYIYIHKQNIHLNTYTCEHTYNILRLFGGVAGMYVVVFGADHLG